MSDHDVFSPMRVFENRTRSGLFWMHGQSLVVRTSNSGWSCPSSDRTSPSLLRMLGDTQAAQKGCSGAENAPIDGVLRQESKSPWYSEVGRPADVSKKNSGPHSAWSRAVPNQVATIERPLLIGQVAEYWSCAVLIEPCQTPQ